MKPGQMHNIEDVGLSESAAIRAANSTGSMNTPESSGQVMNANRLNQVPNRNPDGTSEINTLGRAPLPIPGGIP